VPVEIGVWRLGTKVERVQLEPMAHEAKLEDILAQDISIIDPNLMLVGRQVRTKFDKVNDLLAMDADGNLVVIELKRHRTPREVVAQLLDYGSWVRTLEDEDIAAIFDALLKRYHPERAGTSLDDAFRQKFNVRDLPESLNEHHELVVVTGETGRQQRADRYLFG
jgi:hypothetical protein